LRGTGNRVVKLELDGTPIDPAILIPTTFTGDHLIAVQLC